MRTNEYHSIVENHKRRRRCRELARIFKIDDHLDNHASAVLLDLYYYTLQFARDNQFTKEQTSAFFSIVKKTHEACVGQ